MTKGFMFGSFVNIWDFHENEQMKIGIRTCKNPSLVSIYGQCGSENCMVVLIEILHKAFEKWKLFCPTSIAKYCGSTVGMEDFWPFKDLSLNDELAIMMLDQNDLTMDGVNNLVKKLVS